MHRKAGLLSAARLSFASTIQCGHFVQTILGNLAPFLADGVMHPLALLASGDKSGIAEDLHVVGQGWLADIQLFQQLAGTFLSGSEQLHDLHPVLITQCLED